MKRVLAAAALPLILLSSCSLKDYKYTTKSDSVDIEVDTEKVTAVKLSNDVGDIDISYGEGNTAKIHVDYKFRGIKEDAVSTAYDHISCKSELKDDVLEISFVDPETGKSFSEWKKDEPDLLEATSNIELVLPEKFESFDIDTDVGSVKADGLKGNFSLSCDVGNVDLTELELLGDSDFSTDVGNIKLDIKSVEKCEVKAVTDVGDIKIKTSGLSVESEEEEKTTGGKSEVTVDGKCKMKLECNVGKIKLSEEDKDV